MDPMLPNSDQMLVDDIHQKASPQPVSPKGTKFRVIAMPASISERAMATKEVRRGRSRQHRDPDEGPSRTHSTKAKDLEQGVLSERQHPRENRSLDNGRGNDDRLAEHMGGATWIHRNERGSVEQEPERRRHSGKEHSGRDRRGRDYKGERVNDRGRSRPRR